MKLEYFVLGILLAAAMPSALAQQNTGNSSNLTGQVETVYVRESRNLFIEKRLVRRSEHKELWAEVRVENPLRNEYVTELARLPDHMLVERGDLVEALIMESTLIGLAQFPHPGLYAVSDGPAPLPEVNRVTALVAKRDTLRAMLFGLNTPQPRRSLVFEAQACVEKSTVIGYTKSSFHPAVAR